MSDLHEDLNREDGGGRPVSNRAFGLTSGFILLVLSLLAVKFGPNVRKAAFILACLAILAGILRPAALTPLNRLWNRIGRLIAKVSNTIVMAVVFAVIITPAALVLRVLGKMPLERRSRGVALTYWRERTPADGAAADMEHPY